MLFRSGPIAAAYAWTLEGNVVPVQGTQQGDRYTFPVPASECSSVVLAGRLAPVVEWTLDSAAAPGVTRKLTLKLTNVNAQPLRGTATVRLSSGWKAPEEVSFGPIASGQTQTLIIDLTVPATAKPFIRRGAAVTRPLPSPRSSRAPTPAPSRRAQCRPMSSSLTMSPTSP